MAVESVKVRGFGIDAARFVPPALDHAVERGSLIAAIDSVPAPARWLCAPSGAGKSTLVADVARHHAGNVIWYRLDERDDDPAFFFGEWLRHVRLRLSVDELPHFSDSDRGQEVAFARRLLAALMPNLAAPLLLVFDDLHKLACARTSAVLAALASAAGAQLRLIFAGQQPPPVEFYGAIAERRLALCGDVDLRFTPADCLALARRLRLHAPSGDELHALTGGHAAAPFHCGHLHCNHNIPTTATNNLYKPYNKQSSLLYSVPTSTSSTPSLLPASRLPSSTDFLYNRNQQPLQALQ